ncbi:hypothetical protein P691DRAFT_784641 [Macrolepiota fuliginosa MF-IS2]|uniref:Uncharacterized protein n=1 Tax=Macrolepiota fuliginosa MF-IS2 TaxID=1400762 RepID=A0A9P5X7C5_9AGAR|nr:hypothetical protein P691DRAFT_784641 [Macrolepiota fuliginosa MF-IS2]
MSEVTTFVRAIQIVNYQIGMPLTGNNFTIALKLNLDIAAGAALFVYDWFLLLRYEISYAMVPNMSQEPHRHTINSNDNLPSHEVDDYCVFRRINMLSVLPKIHRGQPVLNILLSEGPRHASFLTLLSAIDLGFTSLIRTILVLRLRALYHHERKNLTPWQQRFSYILLWQLSEHLRPRMNNLVLLLHYYRQYQVSGNCVVSTPRVLEHSSRATVLNAIRTERPRLLGLEACDNKYVTRRLGYLYILTYGPMPNPGVELVLMLKKVVQILGEERRGAGESLWTAVSELRRITPVLYVFHRDGALLFIPTFGEQFKHYSYHHQYIKPIIPSVTFTVIITFGCFAAILPTSRIGGIHWGLWLLLTYQICGSRLILNIRRENGKLAGTVVPQYLSTLQFNSNSHQIQENVN